MAQAAVAELRAGIAEIHREMEHMIRERLAQIRQPADGREGPRGEPGEKGQKGEKGVPGELPIVRSWAKDEIFYVSDVVFCEGGTWQARKDNAQKPPHPDWVPLAAGSGCGHTIVARHLYPDERYSALNIVALNGSSFIARTDDRGPCPGDGWQLISTTGRWGQQGPRGERGLPGRPSIDNWRIDPERYRATPLMSDGSEGPTLELRPLFEQYHTESSG